MSTASTETSGKTRRNLLVLLPLAVFLALAALFLFRLGSGDPSQHSFRADRASDPADRFAAGARTDARRQAGAGPDRRNLQGRGDAGECLGLVVRALSRRGAVPGGAVEGQAHPTRRHQLQGLRPTMRGASSTATAIRLSPPGATPTDARPSIGASTACRKHFWSDATAASPTSWWGRSPRPISRP